MRRVALYVKAQENQENQETQENHPPERKEGKTRKLCTRGLESLIEGRSSRKEEAKQCVMTIQQLLRDQGRFDDEAMALIYKAKSNDSAAIARERASKDAEAVAEYLGR